MAKVISLDDATKEAFSSDKVMHRPLHGGQCSLDALWVHRIVILRELLSQGNNLIHSDADAIWVKDPIPEIENYDDDMVFSQGTFWPRDVHSKRGLVLCCGFFHLRPSPSTFAFLDAVQERMAEDQDDQIAMNRVISGWIGEWKIEEQYEIPFKDTRFFASASPIRSTGTDRNGRAFSISVLPHHSFPRLVKEISDEVVVAHPLSGKTMEEKEAILGELGLWKV